MDVIKQDNEKRREGPPPLPETPEKGELTPEQQAEANLAETGGAAQEVHRGLEKIDQRVVSAGAEYTADEKGDKDGIAGGLEAAVGDERQRTADAMQGSPEAGIDFYIDESDFEGLEDSGGPERREAGERLKRRAIGQVLANRNLDSQAAIEVLASLETAEYNQELVDGLDAIAGAYGLSVEQMSDDDREEMLAMYKGFKESPREATQDNIAEAMEQKLHERIVATAIERVDNLQYELVHSEDLEQLKGSLRATMESMAAIAQGLKSERQGAGQDQFTEVMKRFNLLGEIKDAGKSEKVGEVFKSVFEEFQDFIEDDVFAFVKTQLEKKGVPFEVEGLMQKIYGRSKGDVEAVKGRNRARVAERIKEMADQGDINLEMVQELHRINNDSVVPKSVSKIRTETGVSFGEARRLGLVGEDLQREMALLMERANDLIDRKTLGKVSETRYTIEAAALHNDMLDMHPFEDRNGSTSLLFLELLMANNGVEPPAEREKGYYKKLHKIVGGNLAAMAVVGYEQAKMTYVPGAYAGKTVSKRMQQTYKQHSTQLRDSFKQMVAEAERRKKARQSARGAAA